MKYKTIIISLLILATWVNIVAQSTLQNVLSQVEKNNKSLVAEQQFWEARKLEYQTGLSLPNPTVQGQYLFGSPAAAGNQVDFFAVQPFDYPSAYKKRRQLAAEQGQMSTSRIAVLRQEILLETNLTCLELVYRNKLAAHYKQRKTGIEKLLADFQKKLEAGDGNILDVNKTKLQLLEINQLQQENTVEAQKLQTHLAELNGGEAVTFQDTIYPPLSEIEPFEQLEAAYEAADPMRHSFEQEKRIAEKRLEVAKTWRLPKFELGYHYQGILGQRFNGLHAGITLPFWEQKYRTQSEQAQVFFTDLQLQNHQNEHFFEIKEIYERQATLRQSLDEYSAALSSVSNAALLNKALQLGEITTIEYFMEISFYQNALLHFLKTEREYHMAVAELMQYKL